MIRRLKLQGGQKTGLVSIFAFGAFVIAASIVRMVMLRSSAGSTDPTWGSSIALEWTEIEANTSVIVCCLPALRVPFLNLWHRVKGDQRSPTVNTFEARQRYNDAWTGPQHTQAMVTHEVEKPQRVYHSNNIRASINESGSNDKSTKSQSSLSNHRDTWYDKVLNSINGDQPTDDASRSSSQDELARAEAAIPPKMDLSTIYKTTDIHVSTGTRRSSDAGGRKQVTLQEMLDQDR